jgi:hypothetical protein
VVWPAVVRVDIGGVAAGVDVGVGYANFGGLFEYAGICVLMFLGSTFLEKGEVLWLEGLCSGEEVVHSACRMSVKPCS